MRSGGLPPRLERLEQPCETGVVAHAAEPVGRGDAHDLGLAPARRLHGGDRVLVAVEHGQHGGVVRTGARGTVVAVATGYAGIHATIGGVVGTATVTVPTPEPDAHNGSVQPLAP